MRCQVQPQQEPGTSILPLLILARPHGTHSGLYSITECHTPGCKPTLPYRPGLCAVPNPPPAQMAEQGLSQGPHREDESEHTPHPKPGPKRANTANTRPGQCAEQGWPGGFGSCQRLLLNLEFRSPRICRGKRNQAS